MISGERSASEEWTVLESVAFTRSDHHHGLGDHFRLTRALELDRNCTCLSRTATFVTLAYTAVLHRILINALTLAVYNTTSTITPCTSALSASTTSAGLNIITAVNTSLSQYENLNTTTNG